MAAVYPLVNLAPDLYLHSNIPLSANEEIGENTQRIAQVNIATAYLNRGFFDKAKDIYSKVYFHPYLLHHLAHCPSFFISGSYLGW